MFERITENLTQLGYGVSVFETATEAAVYLNHQIDGQTVGLGGSMTLGSMGIGEQLSTHNTVYWHQGAADKQEAAEMRTRAMTADVYLSSANGIAETGEIINIDGTCNRVSATLYGHKKVYIVVGRNKIAADYDSALYRARNIAAPLNAKRFGLSTPCAIKGDKCYDCKSPDRICRALTVFWTKPNGCDYEVVIINEDLGF